MNINNKIIHTHRLREQKRIEICCFPNKKYGYESIPTYMYGTYSASNTCTCTQSTHAFLPPFLQDSLDDDGA